MSLVRRHEVFLKGALAAVLLLLAPLPAFADLLIVGTVRDQDGAAVQGAAAVAVDAGGAALARDRTAADGTFALSAARLPQAVEIAAPDVERLRIAVSDDRPLIAIVRRHRSADLVPSPADVAALPAGQLPSLAAVIPYRVSFPSAISDRYLARGRGAVEIDGLPFYRPADGTDATPLLPDHGAGALAVRDPLWGAWYGDRAGGGLIDAQLFDRADVARATDRDVDVRAGGRLEGLAVRSWDDDGRRDLAAASASGTFARGTGNLEALAGTAPAGRYSALAAELHLAQRRGDLAARVALTTEDGLGVGRGDVASLVVDAAGSGAHALAARLRVRDERGPAGGDIEEHRDAALVVMAEGGSRVTTRAMLALAYGGERYADAALTSSLALLPSLSVDAPLTSGWSFHAGFAASTLGTPEIAIARSSLGEAALRYADGRRLRGEIVAYAEGDAAPRALARGVAASLGWEIAPRLSLRTWLLRDHDARDVQTVPYAGAVPIDLTVARALRRDLVWLTWDAPSRLDVLVRNGALEGSIRIPVGGRVALVAGSALSPRGLRVLSLGMSAR